MARAGIKIKGSCLRAIAPRFKSSAEGCQAFVTERSSGNYPLCFLQTSIAANIFGWIAVIQPVMNRFQELHGKQGFTQWTCTTDWTHRLCHLGLSVWIFDGDRAPSLPWRIMEAKCLAFADNLWAAGGDPGIQARLRCLANTKRVLPLPSSSLNGEVVAAW